MDHYTEGLLAAQSSTLGAPLTKLPKALMGPNLHRLRPQLLRLRPHPRLSLQPARPLHRKAHSHRQTHRLKDFVKNAQQQPERKSLQRAHHSLAICCNANTARRTLLTAPGNSPFNDGCMSVDSAPRWKLLAPPSSFPRIACSLVGHWPWPTSASNAMR